MRRTGLVGLLVVSVFVLLVAPALAQEVTWVRQVSTWLDDYGYEAATDSGGNVYLASAVEGSEPSEPVPPHRDALLVKYSPSGTEMWRRILATDSHDHFYGVAVDAQNNVYAAGVAGTLPGQTVFGGALLAKYDPNGNLLWVRQFEGDGFYDAVHAVTVAPDGSIVVAGFTNGALPGWTSNGGEDIIVLKFSAAGDPVWAVQFGSAENDQANGVDTDGGGNIFVAASMGGSILGNNTDAALWKLKPDGFPVWLRVYNPEGLNHYGNDVAADAAGNAYLVAGVDGQDFPSVSAALVRKYDPNGNVLWTDKFQAPDDLSPYTSATAADLDAAGNLYVAGTVSVGRLPGQNNEGDFYVRKYAPDGTLRWTHQFGPTLWGNGEGVAAGPGGAVYMAGYAEDYPGQPDGGGNDAFLVRLDGAGDPVDPGSIRVYLPLVLR